MAKALNFIDPHDLSMTVVLTALNRFLQVTCFATSLTLAGLYLTVGACFMDFIDMQSLPGQEYLCLADLGSKVIACS